MLTIGIETSSRIGEIALCRDDQFLEECQLPESGRRHAQTLITAVDDLLERHSFHPEDCDVVAVGIGPGSFTGLRIGVVFAKTFAYATGCALAAVDTLEAIAYNSPPDVSDLHVIADAQRGDLYVGRYQRRPDGTWMRTQGIDIRNAQQWYSPLQADDVITGPGIDKFESQLAPICHLLEPADRKPRASWVARLGARQVADGIKADPWRLEPFYLRKSAAEEKWESAQKRSGQTPP